MPCEGCAVQFSVFKRKRVCCECERYYCSGCLRRGGGAMCAPCRVLSTRPLYRNTISHLKVRDLQCFLQRQNVSTRGCVEKEELINLCVLHVNGATYRRRGARSTGAFSSLKGLTNNINDFINNAFDLRAAPTHPPAQSPEPAANTRNCFNSTHAHRPPASPGDPPDNSSPTSPPRPQSERFTTTPGGEADIRPPVPAGGAAARADSADSARVDTADCFEIEDLDDSTWELVARPADPLPNDSDILLRAMDEAALRGQASEEAAAGAEEEAGGGGGARGSGADFVRVPAHEPPRWARPAASEGCSSPDGPVAGALGARAASELELRSGAPHEPAARRAAASSPASPRHVTLEQMERLEELEALSVKQLKELLTRNRVEYRGCLERDDLLQRARLLWRTHSRYRDEMENLPIEESCKICMAAPLECVLLECGHIAACTACSKQLAECPICRQYVVRAVRFFRS